MILQCTRRDGSTTWQRQDSRRAAFFVFHDLRHFAVEAVLGAREAFFGLIADGWEITDTDGKSSRGPLPDEARMVEHLVGLLDRERVGGAAAFTAAEIRAEFERLAMPGNGGILNSLTDAQLHAIRTLSDELHGAWAETEATMELALDRQGR